MKSKAPALTNLSGPSIINLARERPNQQALILVVHSAEAKRILAAWELQPVECSDRPLKANESLPQGLEVIWDGAKYDIIRLAEDADVPYNQAKTIFDRLRNARLIFPDGSISDEARRIILADVATYIRGLIPRKK